MEHILYTRTTSQTNFGVKMASAAAVAAGTDRRDVSRCQGHLCGGPKTGGGGKKKAA